MRRLITAAVIAVSSIVASAPAAYATHNWMT